MAETTAIPRKELLAQLARLLQQVGSANDAEDHSCVAEALRMRQEACASLLGLLAMHPWLQEALPELEREVKSGHILGVGWSSLLSLVHQVTARDDQSL